MTPRELVEALKENIIDGAVGDYQSAVRMTPLDQASDPFWRELLRLYSGLNDDDRKVLLDLIRQVSVDTVSHLLGILDGTSYLTSSPTRLVLTREGLPNERLNGDLQEKFLELMGD